MVKQKELIRLDDKLVYQGSYFLPVRALKTICYLIAQYVNPEGDKLPESIVVPLTEIVDAISPNKGNVSKSIYKEIRQICRDLTSNPIEFDTGVEVQGITLKGYINWCSSAIPYKNKEDGRYYIEFSFDKYMSQFLVGLTQYVRLYRPELNRITKTHAIRLFQIFRGMRNRDYSRGVKVSSVQYTVERFKFLLGVADKYEKFKYLNDQVIKPAIKEINSKTSVRVINVEKIRKGRQIVEIVFRFIDQEINEQATLPKGRTNQDYKPSKEEIAKLTRARKFAYERLTEAGVKPGIAFKQILPSLKGSEIDGFEDKFVEFSLAYIQRKAKSYNGGVIVKWWLEKQTFDPTSQWSTIWAGITEEVIAFKREMEVKKPEAWANRQLARELTSVEFDDVVGFA